MRGKRKGGTSPYNSKVHKPRQRANLVPTISGQERGSNILLFWTLRADTHWAP